MPKQEDRSAVPTVLILSAAIGEGHDLPARVLAEGLCAERPDAKVTVADGLPAMGRVVNFTLRDNSAFVLPRMPWLFDFQYWLISHLRPTRWLFRTVGYRLSSKGLAALVAAHKPDIVVSTYPGVTQILGELRLRG